MKKQIIRLTENDIKRLVMESVNQVLMENEQEEGVWDGIKGMFTQKGKDIWKSAKSKVAQAGIGTENWRNQQGTRGKNGQWYEKGKMRGEKNPTMAQSYLNNNIAGDIQKCIKTMQDKDFYLQQMGVEQKDLQTALNLLSGFVKLVQKGGIRQQRNNGKLTGLGDQNLHKADPIMPTRKSSVTPGTTYSV